MIHWLLQTPQKMILPIALLAILGLVFYLLPSLLGMVMSVAHLRWIMALNFLLGWTVLGWLAALVWVLLDRVREPDLEDWPRIS